MSTEDVRRTRRDGHRRSAQEPDSGAHSPRDPAARRSARTLDDVARLSGVSRATVSRVINCGPASETMQRHVQAVLDGTDYRPNAAARTLVTGRSGVVGVVIHLDPHLLFSDPYFSQLLQGIADQLAGQGAGMMLWLGNRTKQETLDHILWMGLLDGVIVTANTREDPLVDGLLASPLPTVLIGHRSADRSASYVDIDHVAAADMVTSHLASIGRRRIGHITGRRGTVAGEDRIEGYRRAMHRAGLSTDGLIVEGDFNRPPGPSALFGCSTAGSTRSSVPTTRWRAARSTRSVSAVYGSPMTSPSRGSTISSSVPISTRRSRRSARGSDSRAARPLSRSSTS